MKRRTFLLASALAGAGITCAACQKGQETLPPNSPTTQPKAAVVENPTQTASATGITTAQKLLHFKPEKTVAGDAHPFYHQGTCYLYYLDEKFNSRLATSTDHLHWTPREITHTPPGGDHPYSMPYFVLGVWHDEKSGLFHTYHGGPNNIMIGNVSRDLVNWDYAPKDTVVWAQDRYRMQRDPYVFWNEDEQKYWVVMTCEVSGAPTTQSGAICYASSVDLTNWEKRGDLLYPQANASIECPQMFKLGGRWYLFGSVFGEGHVGKLSYWVSDAPTGPWKSLTPPSLDGEDLCAANMAWNGQNWVMFGWIPLLDGPAHGTFVWGGHIAFPRDVFLLPDGALGTRLVSGLGTAIRGQQVGNLDGASLSPIEGTWTQEGDAWTLDGGYGMADLGIEMERIDADLDVRLPLGGGYAGLRMAGPDRRDKVEIVVDHEKGILSVRNEYKQGAGRDYARLELAQKESFYHLRVIVEENMVEVFVNDRYSLAARIPENLPLRRLGLSGMGEKIQFTNTSVFRLKTLDETV